MTWWDHETESIWSQPWGRALHGDLKGTQLQIIPFSLEPWSSWIEKHPDTLVLHPSDGRYSGEPIRNDFVLGVAIGDHSRAYPFDAVSSEIIVQDNLGGLPLVIHTNPETRAVHIYISQLSDGTPLTFTGDAEQLIDDQTGTIWNPSNGLAIEGELQGEGLREIPYTTSFLWAWFDFYPTSSVYESQ